MTGRLATGLALTAAAVAVAVLLFSPPPEDPIRPGQAAPLFELPRLEGDGSISLARLRGRVVLVNFWATWCKPCEAEMPAMEQLHRALGGPDFELVAISVDASREDVAAFRDRLGLTFPIALDPERRVASAYQSYRFPESYLIDREGRIVQRYIGERDWDMPIYVDHIRRVIAGQRDAQAPR